MAEIVGTLMLVLIVVAAATAFAFFVSTYEQTQLNEDTALHFKNLENVTIQSISQVTSCGPGTPPCGLTVILSSSDIYATNLTDIAVAGDPAVSFCQTPASGPATYCSLSNNTSAHYQRFYADGGMGYVNLTSFTVTAVTINYTGGFLLPFSFPVSTVQIQMGSARGNEFVMNLYPPVAEFGIDFITNYPVLDGAQSYQPTSTSSPTTNINQWVWTVFCVNDTNYSPAKTYYGQQAQLPYLFLADHTYTITLTVSDTLGLQGTASGTYTAP